MSVLVRIPSPLRGLTEGQKTLEVEGKTVSDLLQNLETKYPGIRSRIYEEETQRPLFNLYLNNEDIRVLNKTEGRYELGINNPVQDGDLLSIVPPIAGGTERP